MANPFSNTDPSNPSDPSNPPRRRWSRRRLLRGLALTGAAMVADELWWEPWRLVVERVSLAFPGLPAGLDGLRLVQLSDLHRSHTVGQAEIVRAVERANALNPDLVVLTGDYLSHARGYAEPCAEALAGLRAPLGRFAILGNHDHYAGADFVAAALRRHGLTVLRNDAEPVERGGDRMWVVGVDDVLACHHNLPGALHAVPANAFKVALIHEPDYADATAHFPVQLQLSGHSHGGQIRLPGIGALHLPRLGRRYPMGLYRIGGVQLYTNRGVGRLQPAVRINCPPEVALITLRAV
jgi:predicted MPP superfamily phosphohydrolase